MYSLLLILSSLLHITTCTVYTVTPDDHYYPNTTCHHCHNLQHYLLNITKYFTSNTQLLFLQGLHHLYTDLIIQNVHNISLIGSIANDTLDTVIQLQSDLSSLSMINISTYVLIKNIMITTSHDNPSNPDLPEWVPLSMKNCSFVSLYHLKVYGLNKVMYFEYNPVLVAINIMGKSYLNYVECYYGKMQLLYTMKDKQTMNIIAFH